MKEKFIELTEDDIETRMTNGAEEIINKKDLDYGNSYIEKYDEGLIISFEAPNNTVLMADFRHNMPTKEYILENVFGEGVEEIENTIDNQIAINDYIDEVIKIEMSNAIDDYDAEDWFNEIWSESFGNHNGFSAFQFVEMLQDDVKFFEDVQENL